MPDTATQIRDYYEAITLRVDPDEILEDSIEPVVAPAFRSPWFRGPVVATGVAILVLLVIGGVAWLVGSDGEDVVDDPAPVATLQQPNTTIPADEAAPETNVTPVPATPGPTLAIPPPSDVLADQWAAVPLDQSVFPPGTDIQVITWGGPGVVMIGRICGNDGCQSGVWTSPDGFAWGRTNPDFGPEAEVNDVAVGGPGLVAVGRVTGEDGFSNAAVWTSSDGQSWDRVPHNDDVFGLGASVAAAAIMENIESGPNGLVVAGVTCLDPPCTTIETIWTSHDGLSWTRHPGERFSGGRLEDFTWFNDRFVAIGGINTGEGQDVAAWTSPDGVTWTQVPPNESAFAGPADEGPVAIAAGPLGVVAVGANASYPGGDQIVVLPSAWFSID